MLPKRRATSQPDAASEPTKRITRSSTKAASQDEVVQPTETPAELRKKKKRAQKDKLSKPEAKSQAPATKKQEDTKTPPRSNLTTFTITSELFKSPIQCNIYSPPGTAPISPHLIFTHGAGGTLSAPAVVNFCTGFSSRLSILAFQGSMNLGARVKGFHACLEHLKNANDDEPEAATTSKRKAKPREEKGSEKMLLLGGRSMGARAATIAVSEILSSPSHSPSPQNIRLILVSYPLLSPKQDLRDKILLDLPAHVRVLFVIGEKDAMCPLDRLESVRSKMSATSKLVVVRGADHGMHVRPARREGEVGVESGRVAGEWVLGDGDGEDGDGDGGTVYIGGEEEEKE